MSNPLLHSFFLGRALAEAIAEQLEHTLTDVLSELGKFDAEQRERLRQFTEQVIARANQAESAAVGTRSSNLATVNNPADLQATIDDLRAEVARLRSELQQYRNRLSSNP
ncbi:MAG: hypothetical protein NZ772_05560 [Cyanobacteria bacterium]|nr:hypothetical protein [Cyanobacteriota bacterium]MDW8201058.1 hypothetical protein [Cyanobacteriota bacterium SKYGB_h_bin112]